jgi:hypothetical protein
LIAILLKGWELGFGTSMVIPVDALCEVMETVRGEKRQIWFWIGFQTINLLNSSTGASSFHNAMADTTEAEAPDSRSELGSSPTFNDEPIYLLERSIALALEHIGFTAASKEALESFRAEVDSCW